MKKYESVYWVNDFYDKVVNCKICGGLFKFKTVRRLECDECRGLSSPHVGGRNRLVDYAKKRRRVIYAF